MTDETRNDLLEQILLATSNVNNLSVSSQFLFGSASFDLQEPNGVDDPMIINYGITPFTGPDVSYDGVGTYTFHTLGTRYINIYIQYGRTGQSQVSELLFRSMRKDGAAGSFAQTGTTIPQFISSATDEKVFFLYLPIEIFVAETEIRQELIRDSNGHNSGDLVPYAPTLAGVGQGPSAQILIFKEKVVSS